MTTLGDILKQNKISLKSSVEPHYRRFSDAYLSLKGSPVYADLVAFERDLEHSVKFKSGPWNAVHLNRFVNKSTTYDSFKTTFNSVIQILNARHNNMYTDELLNTIWTQILTLKQQVH